ncbi:putative Arf GTPase activating protein [Helianthus anomalus]
MHAGKKKLKDLLQQSDNRTCADCGAHDPKWASPTIGVFICLKCCGGHRLLGPNISKRRAGVCVCGMTRLGRREVAGDNGAGPRGRCAGPSSEPAGPRPVPIPRSLTSRGPLLFFDWNCNVLSVTIDEWTDEEIDAMIEVGGNSSANAIYEAHVPDGVKPGPDASSEQRTKYIR